MGDHILDLILLGLLVLFGLSGYRQGFIVGLLSFAGFVGGGVGGMLIAPTLASGIVGDVRQAVLAIVIAFLSAAIGQLVASWLGGELRRRVSGKDVHVADAAGGAVVSALSLLVVAWFLGNALSTSLFQPLRTQIAGSAVLGGVDEVMPGEARTWFSSFQGYVASSRFPQLVGGLGGEMIVDVPPPDPATLKTEAMASARRSIVKVVGTAQSCLLQIEGTGFVYAPERVMTNAHVVAGVRAPSVFTTRGVKLAAQVVLYDPRRDVAVLKVPGMKVPPVQFSTNAQTGDQALVVGYPKGRTSFLAVAARIRARQRAKLPDIYRSQQVVRDIYSLRGTVRQGNSGGPLFSVNGTVYGVIFATALDGQDTGYALTADEVAQDAEQGRTATAPVSTGACAEG